MNNKKGFTIVELLVAIIIVGLIVALTASTITKVADNQRAAALTKKIQGIENAAAQWGISNYSKVVWNQTTCNVNTSLGVESIPCETYEITVQRLIDDLEYSAETNGQVIDPVTRLPINSHRILVSKRYDNFYGDYLND